MSSKNVQS